MVRSDRLFQLLGETAREIGILMLMFAPLDSVFTPRTIDQEVLSAVVLLSVLFIAGGILLETRE